MKLPLGTFALCVVLALSLKTDKLGTSTANANAASRFGDAEHMWIGNSLTLTGLTDTNASAKTFTMGTTAQALPPVSFGQIVNMAGDWVGASTLGEIVCSASSDDARRVRAEALRSRFSTDEVTPAMFDFLLTVTTRMKKAVDNVPGNDETTPTNPKTMAVMMATKGGNINTAEELEWHHTMNFFSDDHFGGDQCAHRAYQTFHDLALEEAAKGQTQAFLIDAYFYEAIGFHYLSDLFSAGHVRNPAATLRQDVCKVLLGSFAVNVMHDEDGYNGLYMTNRLNEPAWWLYGDYFFWSPDNHENKLKINTALQASVNEVHASWLAPGTTKASITGHSQSTSTYAPLAGKGLDYVPDFAKSIEYLGESYWTNNTCPLFLIHENIMYRRWPWVRPRSDSSRASSLAPSRNRFGTETADLPAISPMQAYTGSQVGYELGGCKWKKMIRSNWFHAGQDCGRFNLPPPGGLTYSPEAGGFLVKGPIVSCLAFRTTNLDGTDLSICDSVKDFNEEKEGFFFQPTWIAYLIFIGIILVLVLWCLGKGAFKCVKWITP